MKQKSETGGQPTFKAEDGDDERKEISFHDPNDDDDDDDDDEDDDVVILGLQPLSVERRHPDAKTSPFIRTTR